jgi:hypothetical protein
MYHFLMTVVKKVGSLFGRTVQVTDVKLLTWKDFLDVVVSSTAADLASNWAGFVENLGEKEAKYMNTYIGPSLSQIVECCAVWLEGTDEETTNYCEAGNSMLKGKGKMSTRCSFMQGLDILETVLDTSKRNQSKRDTLYKSLSDVALKKRSKKGGYTWFPRNVYISLPQHFVSFARRLYPGAAIPFMENLVEANHLQATEYTSEFHTDREGFAVFLGTTFEKTPKVSYVFYLLYLR